MLTNMAPLLAAAQAGQYAVGSFNVYSYETIRGVLEVGAKSHPAGHCGLR